MKAPTFDISSQAYKRNPYPTLARMIEQGPLVRMKYPLMGRFWAVTHYDAVNELLRDHTTFVRDPRSAGLKKGANMPWWFPRSIARMRQSMIIRDEPDHRRLRSLVEQAFARRSIEQLRPRFVAIASGMLDELEAKQRKTGEPVDLVAGLARPLPLAVICELLGLPPEDRPMFVQQAETLTGGPSFVNLLRIFSGFRHVMDYARQQIERARRAPHDGLISALVSVEQNGQRLSEDEMVSMILLLLLAGHVTTVHLIGAGVYTLLGHPEQKAELTSNGSLITSAVNELLRYVSPVQTSKPMLAARDLEFRGQSLKRGERILAQLAAANVDPRQFPEPERFDVKREPNAHVAFGAGPHVCLGWKLAVAEAEIAFEQLFTRYPKLQLAVPAERLAWSRQLGTRGVAALPVRLA